MALDAKSAGSALSSIAEALLSHDVVAPEGYGVLTRVATELKRGGSSLEWLAEVDPGEPVLFRKVAFRGEEIIPKIVACIGIRQTGDPAALPFDKHNIALTLFDAKGGPLSRWHIDRANEQEDGFQSGPLMHMQFGGHEPGVRHEFTKLSVPRWCHPPMDLALLCEIVAANIYEDQWLEFREEPSWCRAISAFEQLCWTPYFQAKLAHVETSSTTALNKMWANSAIADGS